MQTTPWYVYLLYCSDQSLYCGISTDPKRRLAQHNAGKASKYTRTRLPVQLAASIQVKDKATALRLELAVKKKPRTQKITYLLAQEKQPSI